VAESHAVASKDGTWVVRCLEGEYALTNRPGCYTIYLHTSEQKITFIHALRAALDVMKKLGEEIACVYTGWVALYLTQNDIKFLLETIKLNEVEEQVANTEIPKNLWSVH